MTKNATLASNADELLQQTKDEQKKLEDILIDAGIQIEQEDHPENKFMLEQLNHEQALKFLYKNTITKAIILDKKARIENILKKGKITGIDLVNLNPQKMKKWWKMNKKQSGTKIKIILEHIHKNMPYVSGFNKGPKGEMIELNQDDDDSDEEVDYNKNSNVSLHRKQQRAKMKLMMKELDRNAANVVEENFKAKALKKAKKLEIEGARLDFSKA